MKQLLMAAIIAASLVGVVACAPSSPSGGSAVGGASSAAPATSSVITAPPPGRTAKRGGRVEVTGTLQRDESGTWLVIGAFPMTAPSGHVIGVIVNPTSIAGVNLVGLENSYVRVTGTASQGVATDKSGLGVIADTVTKYQVK